MNEDDHSKVPKQIEKFWWTDPEDLLPGDERLLNEDFDAVGRASAIKQLLWAVKIEASMKAMNHGRQIDNEKERRTEIKKGQQLF